MATEIEYEPTSQSMAVDMQVQTILNAFPKTGEPLARPDIGCKLEFGDGAQRLIFYTEGDTQRHEIRYVDLPNDNDTDKQTAHERAKELLTAVAPVYFEHSVSLVLVKVESGNTVVVLTYR